MPPTVLAPGGTAHADPIASSPVSVPQGRRRKRPHIHAPTGDGSRPRRVNHAAPSDTSERLSTSGERFPKQFLEARTSRSRRSSCCVIAACQPRRNSLPPCQERTSRCPSLNPIRPRRTRSPICGAQRHRHTDTPGTRRSSTSSGSARKARSFGLSFRHGAPSVERSYRRYSLPKPTLPSSMETNHARSGPWRVSERCGSSAVARPEIAKGVGRLPAPFACWRVQLLGDAIPLRC